MVMVVNTHRTLYIGFVHGVLQLCTVSLAEEKCSALSVKFIFKVLLNFLRTAKVDRELRRLLLLARLYRLRENLQI